MAIDVNTKQGIAPEIRNLFAARTVNTIQIIPSESYGNATTSALKINEVITGLKAAGLMT